MRLDCEDHTQATDSHDGWQPHAGEVLNAPEGQRPDPCLRQLHARHAGNQRPEAGEAGGMPASVHLLILVKIMRSDHLGLRVIA